MKPLRDREFLVIERRPTWLRVAVVRCADKKVEVLNVSEALAADFAASLRACLDSLATKRKALPRKAVLVATEAMPAFLNLQIAANTPAEQANEMLRWEAEESFEEFHRTPSLAKALLLPDFFGSEERAKMVAVMRDHPTGVRAAAEEAGIIDAAELDLIEQVFSNAADAADSMEFAWSDSRVGFVDTAHTLISGAPGTLKREVSAILADRGIALHSVVPWWVTGLGLVRQDQIQRGNFVLLHRSLLTVAALFFTNGVLRDVRAYHTDGPALPNSLVKDIASEGAVKLGLIGGGMEHGEVLDDLELGNAKVATEVWLPVPGMGPSERELWPIAGAARLCAFPGDVHYGAPLLDAAPPPSPVWQKPVLWWAAALVILVPLWLSWVGGAYFELKHLEKTAAIANKEMDGLKVEMRIREQASQEHAAAMKRMKELDAELKKWEESGQLAGTSQFTNVDFYLTIMAAAAQTLSGSVQLEQFSVDYKGRFGAEGGGMSNEAIHLALGRFYQQVSQWKVTTEPLTVHATEDGLLPFHFSLSTNRDATFAAAQ